jgi:hypothetical protein
VLALLVIPSARRAAFGAGITFDYQGHEHLWPTWIG